MPTATGKSIVIADFVTKAFQQYSQARVLILTHVKELIGQNHSKLQAMWSHAPSGIYSAGLNRKETSLPILFCGIQSVVNNLDAFGWRDLLLVDECDLIPPDGEGSYLTVIEHFKKINPRLKIIGFTATPYRQGLGLITAGKIFTDICIDMTTHEWFAWFIANGYLSRPIPQKTRVQIDTTGVGTVKGEYNLTELQQASDKHEITLAACQEAIHYGSMRRSWLTFCSGIEHAEHAAEILNKLGIETAVVHSKISSKLRDERIKAWKAGELRNISNNGVLTVGIDNPRLDLIFCLRATQSPRLWCLDEQTEVLTSDGFKKYNEMTADTMLGTMNKITKEFEYKKITGYIYRDLYVDEYMVSLATPLLDIRVSDKHTMLISTKKFDKTYTDFFEIYAKDILTKSVVKVPVSAINKINDNELTDDELTFIGLFMTDGTLDKTSNALSIFQSERYPLVLEMIKNCIENLGLKYKETIEFRPPYYPLHRFRISYGKPRLTDKHLRGWGYLSKWIDKNFPLELMNVSTRQFDILLKAIVAGDGRKQIPSMTWTMKTDEVSSGNITFIERLQITALKNGYKANLSKSHCYILHLKKIESVTISKSIDGRKGWIIEQHKPEKVWCVSNENQTLIIRRNGKTVIVGNCQIVGRGMRVSPETGKENCLVLDFAGNTQRLGTIDAPVIPKKKGEGNGEIPVKLCEDCGAYNHISARVCCQCQKEFAIQVKFTKHVHTDELLKSEVPVVESFNIDKVLYSKNINRKTGNETVRVTYHCGLRTFDEFLSFNARANIAAHKAREWWRQRMSGDIPESVTDALQTIGEAAIPKRMRVWCNKKPYIEILGYEF